LRVLWYILAFLGSYDLPLGAPPGAFLKGEGDTWDSTGRMRLKEVPWSTEILLTEGNAMDGLKTTLDSLKRARRRRKDLKRLINNLIEQYRLVKREEELHEKRAKILIREREYSAYLDTIKMDKPSE
jgi:hypothetical protein